MSGHATAPWRISVAGSPRGNDYTRDDTSRRAALGQVLLLLVLVSVSNESIPSSKPAVRGRTLPSGNEFWPAKKFLEQVVHGQADLRAIRRALDLLAAAAVGLGYAPIGSRMPTIRHALCRAARSWKD